MKTDVDNMHIGWQKNENTSTNSCYAAHECQMKSLGQAVENHFRLYTYMYV